MHNAIFSGRKHIYFIHAFIMFILIHKQFIEEIKYTRILIWKRSWPATSYVTATFHPNIDQCAHQSLSLTATPKLGMIPQGTREQQAYTWQYHTSTVKPKHRWVS